MVRGFLFARSYRREASPPWRTAQFDTIRLRLIKIAARVDELKTRIRVRLPTACPHQPILNLCVERLPRLRLLT
jgi:hypothetical protein